MKLDWKSAGTMTRYVEYNGVLYVVYDDHFSIDVHTFADKPFPLPLPRKATIDDAMQAVEDHIDKQDRPQWTDTPSTTPLVVAAASVMTRWRGWWAVVRLGGSGLYHATAGDATRIRHITNRETLEEAKKDIEAVVRKETA